MEKLDYKKEYKDLYLPKITPSIINVPKMKFVIVEGKGNPNEENGEYKQALSLLYGISFTIKMSKMGKNKIEGYFEYVVPPLEGLWWQKDSKEIDYNHKEKFEWISMIRQPEFVTQEIFEWACDELKKKKQLDISKIKFIEFEEGLCVQTMHIGSYDNEPQTLKNIDEFIKQNNLKKDIGKRKHHEIYLSDPRRTIEKKLKTVIRIPVVKDEK